MIDPETSSDDIADLRRRAEKMLREKADQSPQDLACLSPEEILKILHELRVHQIELEIQNEELRRSQFELKTARERYFNLYDLAPVGYVTLSEKGLILDANLTAAGLLGVARGTLVKRPLSRFVLKEDQDIYYLHRKHLFESGEPQQCDLRMLKKDGTPFWAHLAAIVAQDGEGAPLSRTVISDITERKQASQTAAKQNNTMLLLNRFSIGLNMLSSEDNLEAFIARSIKEIVGAEVALFSKYNPEDRTSTVQYIEMKPELLQKVVSLLGKQVKSIHSVVSDEIYREMTTEIIGKRKTLYEASFEAIPRLIGDAVQALIKVDRFIGLAYLIEGKLYGTSLLGMSKDQPDPPREILENVIHMVALSLRRKQVEDALAAQRQTYEQILEQSLAGYWDWDILTGDEYLSPTFKKMFGYEDDEIENRAESWQKLIFAEDLPGVYEKFNQHTESKGEIPFYNEVRYHHKNGSTVWVICTGKVIEWDDDRKAKRMIGCHINITERKQTEESLYASQQLAESIIESIPGTFYMLDEAGKYVRWSAYQRDEIIGKPDDQIAGFPAIDTIHPDDRALIQARIANVLRTGVVETVEGRVLLRGGPKFQWLLMTGRQLVVAGHPYLVGIGIDITERKQAEEKQSQTFELLTNLARLVPSVIYQYRLFPDGRSAFPYSSPGMYMIYEVTPEEVQEDATPVFGRLHPEDYDRVASSIQESARTLEEFYCEYRVILPKQGLRWRWSQAHPERTADGGTLWHGIISDITEIKRVGQEKQQLYEQLLQAQKMESVGRLAGGMAHDFNNLLGVIMGHAETALNKLPPDQAGFQDLKEILKATGRSADLIRQLLAFARKQTISPKVLNLNDTITAMLKMLKRLLGEDIELEWHPGVDLEPIKMDPSQVDQVLVNLLVNARDAIIGVGKIIIETENIFLNDVESQSTGLVKAKYILLRVTDTGCGMDEETFSHLFEPFFTTKEIGKGTGLGLATVFGIIKQNNGGITVSSEVGKGTIFNIYLPTSVERVVSEDIAVIEPPLVRGSGTILMVEDEEALLELGKDTLEELGYVVFAANTPADALRLAQEHKGEIQLLITDVVMPGMNGKKLAGEITLLRPGIKCLFMSGYTADIIADHGVLDKSLFFIQKPFSLAGLADKVRQALEK